MTGTGTQADPYIPTTLTEFIAAVGTSGAYVQLTQDINAADDPAYIGEYTSVIPISAYIDGQGHTLRGLTVRTSSYAFGLVRNGSVKNLIIADLAHIKTGGSNGTFDRYQTGGGQPVISNCRISMRCNSGRAPHTVANGISFVDSSISCEIVDEVAAVNVMITYACNFTRSTLSFNGKILMTVNTANDVFMGTNFSRSAIIVSGVSTSRETGTLSWIVNNIFSGSYLAFLDDTIGATQKVSSNTATMSVAAAGSGVSLDLSSGVTRGTLENLKDKDWLTSVGFLP